MMLRLAKETLAKEVNTSAKVMCGKSTFQLDEVVDIPDTLPFGGDGDDTLPPNTSMEELARRFQEDVLIDDGDGEHAP